MNRRHLLAVSAALAVLSGCGRNEAAAEPSFHGTDISGSGFGRALSLVDTEGRTRTLADFKGKVVVVFFGYTQCPDVCPTTMAELAHAKKTMGPLGDKVQGVFVTLDPERDTAERLKAYLSGFDPSFIALRGTPDQTAAAAKDFKVFYAKVPGSKVPGSEADGYTLDHTAGSFVFDPAGNVRLFVRYGSGGDALAADLTVLLKPAG